MISRIAVFDLDGTLLDTLDDLLSAVNAALAAAEMPMRTRDEVRAFVGDGVEMLIRRAVPADTTEAALVAVLADFKVTYATACEVRTTPYPGVLDLLDRLRAAGVRVAVVSNKFDRATKYLCTRYFGHRVEVAVGEREADGVRKKPAPDTVFAALAALGVPRETLTERPADGAPCVTYIGDSDVDIRTAENAGIPCISVTWGFRDADFLRAHGATVLADTAEQVAALLLS